MTDEAKALVERLRWGAWYYEDPFDGKAYASDDPLEAADLIEELDRHLTLSGKVSKALSERIEALEAGLCEVFEEWAGSEGFIPETAPEGYLLQLTKRMADTARAALAGDSHDQ